MRIFQIRACFSVFVLAFFVASMAACGTDLACGDGTTEKDGKCVPSASGAEATKAALTSVKLLELNVIEEGDRPVYISYPLHVEGTLEVVGDAWSKEAKAEAIEAHTRAAEAKLEAELDIAEDELEDGRRKLARELSSKLAAGSTCRRARRERSFLAARNDETTGVRSRAARTR